MTRKTAPKHTEKRRDAPFDRRARFNDLLAFARRLERDGKKGKPLATSNEPDDISWTLRHALLKVELFGRGMDVLSAPIAELNVLGEASRILHHWTRVYAKRYGADPTALLAEVMRAESEAWKNFAAAVDARKAPADVGAAKGGKNRRRPPSEKKMWQANCLPATEVQICLGWSYKHLTKWLADHPKIHRYKPSKNRLMVHVYDVLHCKAKGDKLAFEAADDQSAEELADGFAKCIEERKAKENKRRASREV